MWYLHICTLILSTIRSISLTVCEFCRRHENDQGNIWWPFTEWSASTNKNVILRWPINYDEKACYIRSGGCSTNAIETEFDSNNSNIASNIQTSRMLLLFLKLLVVFKRDRFFNCFSVLTISTANCRKMGSAIVNQQCCVQVVENFKVFLPES